MSDMINGHHPTTMFTKRLELLIHMLGSPKCVVARISGCPDIFDVKRNFVVTVRRTGTFLVYIYNGRDIVIYSDCIVALMKHTWY